MTFMKRLKVLATVLAAAAVVSCAGQLEEIAPDEQIIGNEIELTFEATFDQGPETKTQVHAQQSGFKTWWTPGDAISIFYGAGANGGSKFTSNITETAASSKFVGSISAFTGSDGDTMEDVCFMAVYPYSPSTSSDGRSLTIDFPSVQSPVAGSFGNNTNVSVAKSNGLLLGFYNVCGWIRFSLTRSDIHTIYISGLNGEVMGGRMNVSFDSNGKPMTSFVDEAYPAKSIIVTPANGGCFTPGENYYVMVPYRTYDKGLSFEFKTSEQSYGRQVAPANGLTIQRSVYISMLDADAEAKVQAPVDSYVDMGPAGKWAEFNLGATSATDPGFYFAWGEAKPKSKYAQNNYFDNFTKYSSAGMTTLLPEDDPATAILGSKWCTPTREQWELLFDTQNYNWSFQEGYGYVVSWKENPDRRIILPLAGYANDIVKQAVGVSGCYWSSSLYTGTDEDRFAYELELGEDECQISFENRFLGMPIRPVYNDAVLPEYSAFRDSLSAAAGSVSNISRIVFETEVSSLRPGEISYSCDNGTVTVATGSPEFFAPANSQKMFYNLSRLTEIENLTALNTSRVTDMAQMFAGCSNLASIDLSGFDTRNVTDMFQIFNACTSLTYLDVSGFDMSNVETGTSMFNACTKISELKLGDSFIIPQEHGMIFGNISSTGSALGGSNGNLAKRCVFDCSEDVWSAVKAITGTEYYKWKYANGVAALPERLREEVVRKLNVTASDITSINFVVDDNTPRTGEVELTSDGDCFASINGGVATIRTEEALFKAPASCDNWLSGLVNLTGIRGMQNLDFAQTTTMHEMFKSCSSLSSIDLDHLRGSAIRDLSDMFYNCSSLVRVTFPSASFFNTRYVTDYSYMFARCSSLQTVEMAGIRDAQNMSYMFYYCTSLNNLRTPVWNTSQVTNFSHMFYNTTGLKSLNLSANFIIATGADTSNMFNKMGCDENESLWSTVAVADNSLWERFCSIVGNDAFHYALAGASGAAVIDADGYLYTRFSSIVGPILGKEDVKKIRFLAGRGHVGQAINSSTGVYGYYDNGVLTVSTSSAKFSVPNARFMFYGFSNLTSIEGLENIDFSTNQSMWSMFKGCSSLTSVDLSSIQGTNVTSVKEMFEGCSNLARVNLSTIHASYLTDLNGMFKNCTNLSSITGLSTFMSYPSAPTDMGYMFSGCEKLTELVFGNECNTQSVTTMRYMFYNCKKLETLDIRSFSSHSLTDISYMFYNALQGGIFSSTIYLGSTFTCNNVTYNNYLGAYINFGKRNSSGYSASYPVRIYAAENDAYYFMRNRIKEQNNLDDVMFGDNSQGTYRAFTRYDYQD